MDGRFALANPTGELPPGSTWTADSTCISGGTPGLSQTSGSPYYVVLVVKTLDEEKEGETIDSLLLVYGFAPISSGYEIVRIDSCMLDSQES